MKKSLLAFALAGCLASAQATDYKFTVTGINTTSPNTAASAEVTTTVAPAVEGFSFKANKNNGSTNPAFNANGKDLRIYAKGDFIITVPAGATLTKVVFDISTQGQKRLAAITASTGTVAAQALGDKTVTWTGEVTAPATLTFTVGESATYGSDGSTKAGQLCFSTFTLDATMDGPAKLDAGMSFPEAEYSVCFGDTFTAPRLTKDTTSPAVYSSSNGDAATVDAETGEVTIVGIGNTVITATCAANDEYYGDEASYLLKVVDPNEIYAGLISGMDDFTVENLELETGLTRIWQWDTKYGLKGSSFVSNTVYSGTSYAISPVIDLAGRQSISMQIEHALNQLKGADRATYCNVYIREITNIEGAWETLALSEWPEGTSWTFLSATADLSAYAGKKVQVGYCYSVPEGSTIAPTWEIYHMYVTGERVASIVDSVKVDTLPVRYFNLQGVEVATPQKGQMVIETRGSNGRKVIVR